MKSYVAVLGRQPRISVAELESLFSDVKLLPGEKLATFNSEKTPDINRLGGTMKIGEPITLPQFLKSLPKEGKITLGLSDFTPHTTPFLAQKEALRIKRMLKNHSGSIRIVPNKTAVLSSAVSLHNHLTKPNKAELLKNGQHFYRVIALSNIESYARRDRERPARDAKVGMLPPKLAQILINLCGGLPQGARLADPFCGTGVLLQEALLMGYAPVGTDLSERMIEYTERNLAWLGAGAADLSVGAARATTWDNIAAVACETYLGPPMSAPPAEIKLREAKSECKGIILGFLKNLAPQIAPGTPVVIAVPAWLRPAGHYERLNILDEIGKLRYNVCSFKNMGQKDLLYARAGQVVAREIIVLRKK